MPHAANKSAGVGDSKWLLSWELSYLLPHVDKEEFSGNVEGHVGIIGIVPKVGDGDV